MKQKCNIIRYHNLTKYTVAFLLIWLTVTLHTTVLYSTVKRLIGGTYMLSVKILNEVSPKRIFMVAYIMFM